ncbi:MAG TPA: ketol-acid reductoisomerase [Kofleriaceae bacterium]|jgi:ketol-acid reductoisomerase|nr:ketol-acid reductoisomerase [Kofleriaceae bacterium]
MATLYYDNDADLELIRARKVGVIGYGSQGHAHAGNLADSGVTVKVGLPATSKSLAKAKAAGHDVAPPSEVAAWADVLMVLTPDTSQPKLWREQLAPHFDGKAGKLLMFAHGFNIHYGTIAPAAGLDVALIAPKAPGHRVRETYKDGAGVPALIAVTASSSKAAKPLAMSYAKALGSTRAGLIETTFGEETETDLFGEQAVLCGGVSHLVRAGFETLVNAGYQPEVAYFECLHELKLIVDLMYRGGLNYMRYSVSDTAEWGDYVSGPRVVGPEVKAAMQQILAEIKDGTFAKDWVAENEQGAPRFTARRAEERTQKLEEVGAKLRALMPFLDAVTVKPGD